MATINRLIYSFGIASFFSYKYKLGFLKFISEYNLVKKNQFKSIQHNLLIQRERLYEIINFAIKNVPYYKSLANLKNIHISKDSIFEDIKKFPILTKDIIRKNWNQLQPIIKTDKFVYNTSGGTTGEPILVLHDNDFKIRIEGAIKAFYENGNYHYGDRYLKLWGNEKEILKETMSYLKIFKNQFLKNITFLNAFKMSNSIMKSYVEKINLVKPRVIHAYVQSIYELSKFIKLNNLKVVPVKSIITTAGVLTEEARKTIEAVFNCRVYNLYGSREISLIAMNCERENKLHINMHQKFVEIVDNNNNVLNEHEKGNIIITNLLDFNMPLIRYQIGDRGSLDYSLCSCGRGLLRLDNVFGRTVDIFRNEMGELIDGEYFTHLFYYLENLKQFQVIQEKINEINLLISTLNGQHLSQEIEQNLTQKIQTVMGSNCIVNIEYKSIIEPSSSGKMRYTISKLSEFNNY